jgi:hypothetical protein
MEKNRFKKLFPHLAKELERGESRVNFENTEKDNPNNKRKWAGYDPDVLDFIQRCDDVKQAEEVIDFLERRGEISPKRASELIKKLQEQGLRGFGAKKINDFYHNSR